MRRIFRWILRRVGHNLMELLCACEGRDCPVRA
jgi:hypothetical protein